MLDRLGDRNALSIDWDPWSLRVVQTRAGRAAVEVVRVLTAPMPEELAKLDNAEGIGLFLRRVLDQQGIGVRRATVDVPRQQAILNLLQLPDAPDEDLVSMVRFQVSKDLPFSHDEAVLDFVKAAARQDGKTADVLVAAIRDDVLAFYKQVCNSAGLRLMRAGLRPYATALGVMRADESAATGRTLVVDIGPKMTEIDLIRDGHLVFSRAAAVSLEKPGAGEVSDVSMLAPTSDLVEAEVPQPSALAPEPSVPRLVVEAMRSFEAYRATDPGCRLDRIIVAGATGIEPAFLDAISERLGSPAAMFEPSLLLNRKVAGRRELSGFAAALGLAFSQSLPAPACFDFLHPKKETPAQVRRLKRVPLVAATAVLMVTAVVVAYWQWVGPKREAIANLRAEIKRLEDRQKLSDELTDRLDEVREWERQGVVWLDEFYRLAEAFPDTAETYAEKLSITSKGQIRVQLLSKVSTGSNHLADNLAGVRVNEGKEPYYVVETGKSGRTAEGKFKFRAEVTATLAEQAEEARNGRRSGGR